MYSVQRNKNSIKRNVSVLEAELAQTKNLKMMKIEVDDKENLPDVLSSSEKPCMFQASNNTPATAPKRRQRSKAPPGKPPYSYVALVTMAIRSSPDRKMTLSEILRFIYEKFPYYRTCPLKWRNAIRHNLTLNDCFVKLPRDVHDQNRGHYWTLDLSSQMTFDEGKYRRRKRKFNRHEQTNMPSYESIPAPSTIPCCPGYPTVHPVAPAVQRRGFTIDEILAPEPNLMNTELHTVYTPASHFVNYTLPNTFIPYYPNMFWSYPISSYPIARKILRLSSQDEDDC